MDRSASTPWFKRRSTVAFALTCVVFVGIKLLFANYPGDFPVKGQTEAFTWPLVAAIILIGACGLLAERAIGFPDAFASSAREWRGAMLATVTGLAYGVLTIFLPGDNPLRLTEWPHVPWPWSIPFYTFGTIFLELLLRLGALCILVWFIHAVILRGRYLMPVFWIVNCIVAAYEVLPIALAHASRGEWLSVVATPVQPLYWSNVFEGWLLYRFGWFSPIVFRLAFYLVWHVIYGGLGPFDRA